MIVANQWMKGRKQVDPTPAEIQAACLAFQNTWTEEERELRAGVYGGRCTKAAQERRYVPRVFNTPDLEIVGHDYRKHCGFQVYARGKMVEDA